MAPEVVAQVMAELIKEGKILHWGISETTEEYLRRAHAICPVTAIQNRYSMMARRHEALFPALEELGVGYVAFSPLANGILTDSVQKGTSHEKDDYRRMMPQYSDEAFEANRSLFALIRDLAAEKEATPTRRTTRTRCGRLFPYGWTVWDSDTILQSKDGRRSACCARLSCVKAQGSSSHAEFNALSAL